MKHRASMHSPDLRRRWSCDADIQSLKRPQRIQHDSSSSSELLEGEETRAVSWSFHAWHAMSTQHSRSEALSLRDMRCLAYEFKGLLREARRVYPHSACEKSSLG